ncbi:MAG: hypothetical protein R3E67_06095 [Pseudomonadales bacterium]
MQPLGTTAIMVTHDIHHHWRWQTKSASYNGEIVASGTPQEVLDSTDPWVRQFVRGAADGPVQFAFPAQTTIAQDLCVCAGRPMSATCPTAC